MWQNMIVSAVGLAAMVYLIRYLRRIGKGKETGCAVCTNKTCRAYMSAAKTLDKKGGDCLKTS